MSLFDIFSSAKNKWRLNASCRNVAPEIRELFFHNNDIEKTKEAKKICSGCPVKIDCLADAVETQAWHCGIRGGVSERKIHKIYKIWQLQQKVYPDQNSKELLYKIVEKTLRI